MEESLREAACAGNLHGVQKVLQSGVNVNSQNSMNGWTALHWACKRGHTSVVVHLLQSGADPSIKTHKGESPLQLATSAEVCKLFSSSMTTDDTLPGVHVDLPIIPNYLKNPVFPYYEVQVDDNSTLSPSKEKSFETTNGEPNGSLSSGLANLTISSSKAASKPTHKRTKNDEPGMTLKVRRSEQDDFIEVEVSTLTYQSLLVAVCEELELAPSDVAKIRKLPNVLVRKDKDVQRLREGQELEVLLN